MNRFQQYAAAGFGGEVIPVIPHDARLSEGSKVDPSQRGEIPGVYDPRSDTWSRITDWTSREFTDADRAEWDTWPKCNVGLRARFFPAISIEVDNDVVVELLQTQFFGLLGKTPVRGRQDSPRVLLPYRLPKGETPPTKRCIAFTLPGAAREYTIEFLGSQEQYVIEGVHPSGRPYIWNGGRTPYLVTAAGLGEVTASGWMV